MSIMYCHYCDQNIDTDYNAEHFIINEDTAEVISCINEEQDKEEESVGL